ncbi:hypothetical protein R1flu_013159 [Riccia fluitans]|uniref:Uncharacterized protein n=1 Tax=Riccia fluitans TaxID=41844 RepID=A0ABD1XEI0_9MARC
MNWILDGERLGLYLMKNKPMDTLVAHEKTEISQSTSEVVKLAGMGTQLSTGRKEPYITFKVWVTQLLKLSEDDLTTTFFVPHCTKDGVNVQQFQDLKIGMELEIARSYTRITTDEEVLDALRSTQWEFKSKDLGDGGQSLAEERRKKENTVGEEYKRRNKKDEGIGTPEQTVGRSDAEIYIELPIDKEEDRNTPTVVADSMPVNLHTNEVDLESEEDVTNKLFRMVLWR